MAKHERQAAALTLVHIQKPKATFSLPTSEMQTSRKTTKKLNPFQQARRVCGGLGTLLAFHRGGRYLICYSIWRLPFALLLLACPHNDHCLMPMPKASRCPLLAFFYSCLSSLHRTVSTEARCLVLGEPLLNVTARLYIFSSLSLYKWEVHVNRHDLHWNNLLKAFALDTHSNTSQEQSVSLFFSLEAPWMCLEGSALIQVWKWLVEFLS